MARAKDVAQKVSDRYWFKLEQVYVIPGFNIKSVEEVEARAEELIPSVRENGIIDPLAGKMMTVDGVEMIGLTQGHARRLAVELLQKREGLEILLPFDLEPKGANDVDLLVSQFTRNDVKPPSVMAIVRGVKRLLSYGLDEKAIAHRLGKSTQWVNDQLRLGSAPEQVQQLVVSKDVAVSPTLAISTIKEHGDRAGTILEDAVATAKAEGKTKATAKHVDRVTSEAQPAKPNLKKVISQILDVSVTSHLTESVEISISNELYQQLLAALGREA